MKKFLLIDDCYIVRSGMMRLICEVYEESEVDEVCEWSLAVEKLRMGRYDLVIMDIQVKNACMFQVFDVIHTIYPETKILVFSMCPECLYSMRLMKAGAMGFLRKDSGKEEITNALHTVLNNLKYISEGLGRVLADNSNTVISVNPFEKLSPRELEIVDLLLAGKSRAEIRELLNIQDSTLATHKCRLFEKLGVGNILKLKELSDQYRLS